MVAVVLALGVALSTAQGTPERLPAPSLGWPALLHVERAAALIGIAAAVLLTGVRALNGRFPVRLGQIEYSAGEREQEIDVVGQMLEQRLRTVEARLGAWEPTSVESTDPTEQICLERLCTTHSR
jgi:hypothetical protein